MDAAADTEANAPASDTLRRVYHLAAPALLYLLFRAVGVLLLSWFAPGSVPNALTKWDGQWYLGIAAGGYSGVPGYLTDAHGMRSPETPIAFFPGYPSVVHLLGYLPGVGLLGAGLLVSLASGVGLAYGLLRLGEALPKHGSRTIGMLLVALVGAMPMSIVFSMAYAEAMFCALAVWSLVFLLRRQWVLAGLLCSFAGLVRPSGLALAAAVMLAALAGVIRSPRSWRIWLGGLLAPIGVVGYAAYVGARMGSVFGYPMLQRMGWDTYFDWGISGVRFAITALTTQRNAFEVITVGLALAALVLFAVAIYRRLPWPLLVYAAGILVMDLGMNGLMGARARLLLPAFVLLIPVAVGLAKRSRPTAICTVLGLLLASGWLGAYALNVWPYAI
ncbi:hypothetical protein [Sciscionella sediminilitoris]|uniref:hypothetical protein n=1 Tax=Sciscionella sediminilitoris TaxID=1445613 RepID=UPI00056A67FE|nr:hypothetical protein [Sciscionella sp. SE31]